MLGVRRVSVTNAASDLQSRGLVHFRRGHLTVVDHQGLLAAARCCYARDCTTYEKRIGPAQGCDPLGRDDGRSRAVVFSFLTTP